MKLKMLLAREASTFTERVKLHCSFFDGFTGLVLELALSPRQMLLLNLRIACSQPLTLDPQCALAP